MITHFVLETIIFCSELCVHTRQIPFAEMCFQHQFLVAFLAFGDIAGCLHLIGLRSGVCLVWPQQLARHEREDGDNSAFFYLSLCAIQPEESMFWFLCISVFGKEEVFR